MSVMPVLPRLPSWRSRDEPASAIWHSGHTGQPEQARDRHAAALTLARQTGDRYQQARALQGLASACQATGRLRPAPAPAPRPRQEAIAS